VLLHLSVSFVSSWLIPHPTVAITNLWIRGMHICTYVCMYNSTAHGLRSAALMVLHSEENWLY